MTGSTVLLLPGWQDSGPGHWQSLWEAQHGYLRVQQHDWMRPLRGDWVAQLEQAVLAEIDRRPRGVAPHIVFAAHSLGCMLVAAWAAHSRHAASVRAALLVAPGDPEREELAPVLSSWSPIVRQRLPFRSLLLASHDDPYCSFERAAAFARDWGSEFVDCGAAGHINADSGLGAWPDGHARLRALATADT